MLSQDELKQAQEDHKRYKESLERKQCGNCRFAAFAPGTGGRYECRRHAPQGVDEYKRPQFPVMYSHDWCGDFEKKPKETT
jgi:hypothetical protein